MQLKNTPVRPAQEQIFLALAFLSFVFTFSHQAKKSEKKTRCFRGLTVGRVVITLAFCSPIYNFITRPGKLFSVHFSSLIFNSKVENFAL